MAAIPPPKVPSTPHNQKRSEGPLPSLVSTLRSDNRDQLISLLSLDPSSNSLNFDDIGDIGNKPLQITHKNRLVFANESLRTLLVYHTLPDPSTRSSTLLKNKNRKGKGGAASSLFTHEETSLGLDRNNPFGIVGTRILFDNHDSYSDSNAENVSPGSFTMTGTGPAGNSQGQGTETIYNPHSQNQMFGDSVYDQRDETDGASVVIYFIHPSPEHIQRVSKAIHAASNGSANNPFAGNSIKSRITKHRIVFLPRINALSKRILTDENVVNKKNVAVHTLDINLIPLEDDVLTCLEMDSTMADCHLNGVPSEHVTHVAQSMRKIQDICGTIPRLQSFGPVGEMVLERTMALRLVEYDPYSKEEIDGQEDNPEIAAGIILDRKIDLVTPLVTPLTYEGLLDDVLKIEAGIIKVETDVISPPDEETAATASGTNTSTSAQNRPKYMHLPLNDLDTLYVEVRDHHVEKFGSFLQEQAKALKESHANFSDKNKDLTEIHQFVKQIPIFTQNLKSLTNHIHLAELIKHSTEQSEFRQRWQTERSMVESESCYEVIEDLIASQYPPFRVLRLLCLQSLTSGGIKASKYEPLKREVVQTYGYEYLFVLQNLEKIGFLRKKESIWDSTSAFSTLQKHLSLIQADVDPLNPDDVSYVSSGYAPISARIIQTAMKGWTGKEDVLRELPGRGIDIVQRSPPEDFSTAVKTKVGSTLGNWASFAPNSGSRSSNVENKPVLLVYFVGGLTYAEIASMRFLSRRKSFPYKIICCTTKIINGSSLLQSLR